MIPFKVWVRIFNTIMVIGVLIVLLLAGMTLYYAAYPEQSVKEQLLNESPINPHEPD
jgi:hypothetical protein